MDTVTPAPPQVAPPQVWSVAGVLLDGLSNRDFDLMAACLAPDLRFRCLLPRGPMEVIGADQAVDHFRRWFGGDDVFEVLDASVGQIGPRICLRWRVKMHPVGTPTDERVVEQHLFTTGNEVIRTLDLLCSGFHSPALAPACRLP
jgi:hypothetical protein